MNVDEHFLLLWGTILFAVIIVLDWVRRLRNRKK